MSGIPYLYAMFVSNQYKVTMAHGGAAAAAAAAPAPPDVQVVVEEPEELCENFSKVDRFISKCRTRMEILKKSFPSLTMMPGHLPSIMGEDSNTWENYGGDEAPWPDSCFIQGSDGNSPGLYHYMNDFGIYTLELTHEKRNTDNSVTADDYHFQHIPMEHITSHVWVRFPAQFPAFIVPEIRDRNNAAECVNDAISQVLIPLNQRMIDENVINLQGWIIWFRINIEVHLPPRVNTKKEKYIWIGGELRGNNVLFGQPQIQWITGYLYLGNANEMSLNFKTLLDRCDVKPYIPFVRGIRVPNRSVWTKDANLLTKITAWILGVPFLQQNEDNSNRQLILQRAYNVYDQPGKMPLPKIVNKNQNLVKRMLELIKTEYPNFQSEKEFNQLALTMTFDPNYIREHSQMLQAIVRSINRTRVRGVLPRLPTELVEIILRLWNRMIYDYTRLRGQITHRSSGSMAPVWKLNI